MIASTAATLLAVVLIGAWVAPRLAPARQPETTADRSAPTSPCRRTRRRGGAPATSLHAAWERRRRRPPADDEVAEWCAALATRLRAGESLRAAVMTVDPPAPLAPHLAPVVLAAGRGTPIADAVVHARRVSPGLDRAVGVLRACATSGGPAAEPLDRTAASLRDRCAVVDERRTQSAQARLSAIVLTVLPIAALAMMLAFSASTRSAVGGPVGWLVIPLGLAANGVGWWWMRRVLRSEP